THLHLLFFPTRRSSDLRATAFCSDRFCRRYFGRGRTFATKEPDARQKYLFQAYAMADRAGRTAPATSLYPGLCSGNFHRFPRTRSEEHTSELQSRENLV